VGMEVEIYNRPAKVEKVVDSHVVVRWQDNGTQGFVPLNEVQ